MPHNPKLHHKELAIQHTLVECRAKVLAILQGKFADLSLSEDSYQEACIRALDKWDAENIPVNPSAWLYTVSRNIAIDSLRRTTREVSLNTTTLSTDQVDLNENNSFELELNKQTYKDDVLRLLFCCCHPQLSTADQMALALKVIGGFKTNLIAKAFLCKEKAMEQRLTRAKKKAGEIANKSSEMSNDGSQHQFGELTKTERKDRLSTVVKLVYLMFNEGYSQTGGQTHIDINLCQQAIQLGSLLSELFVDIELYGMLALLFYQHSRFEARIDTDGKLLTLEQQDRTLWRSDLITRADEFLQKSQSSRITLGQLNLGHYELQASIAAEHSHSKTANGTRWDKILDFYNSLIELKPTALLILNRSVAISKLLGPQAALDELYQIESYLKNYLYFHTTKAGLLTLLKQKAKAMEAFKTALDLNPNKQEVDYIEAQISELRSS